MLESQSGSRKLLIRTRSGLGNDLDCVPVCVVSRSGLRLALVNPCFSLDWDVVSIKTQSGLTMNPIHDWDSLIICWLCVHCTDIGRCSGSAPSYLHERRLPMSGYGSRRRSHEPRPMGYQRSDEPAQSLRRCYPPGNKLVYFSIVLLYFLSFAKVFEIFSYNFFWLSTSGVARTYSMSWFFLFFAVSLLPARWAHENTPWTFFLLL